MNTGLLNTLKALAVRAADWINATPRDVYTLVRCHRSSVRDAWRVTIYTHEPLSEDYYDTDTELIERAKAMGWQPEPAADPEPLMAAHWKRMDDAMTQLRDDEFVGMPVEVEGNVLAAVSRMSRAIGGADGPRLAIFAVEDSTRVQIVFQCKDRRVTIYYEVATGGHYVGRCGVRLNEQSEWTGALGDLTADAAWLLGGE